MGFFHRLNRGSFKIKGKTVYSDLASGSMNLREHLARARSQKLYKPTLAKRVYGGGLTAKNILGVNCELSIKLNGYQPIRTASSPFLNTHHFLNCDLFLQN